MEKKKSLIVLLFTSAILLFIACEQEEGSVAPVTRHLPVAKSKPYRAPVVNEPTQPQVAKVTFSSGNEVVQDTLTYHSSAGRIDAVDWCTHLASTDVNGPTCVSGYTEGRYYDVEGNLDSISGRWSGSYQYDDALRKSIVTWKDGNYYSTSSFLGYTHLYPNRIKVVFATSPALYIDLEVNSSGDLIHKTMTDASGALIEEIRVDYSLVENPLKGMMETTSYAVASFGFDHLIFYYSRHIPETVTINQGPASHSAPFNQVIRYKNQLDASGKLVSLNAFRDQLSVHRLTVEYK
jgi:hypothetical protein